VFLAAGCAAPGAFLTLYPGMCHPLDLSLPQPSDDFLSAGPPPICLGNAYLLLASDAHAHVQARAAGQLLLQCVLRRPGVLTHACVSVSRQLLVDGRPNGLSGDIFRTAAEVSAAADACWLDEPPACGAAAGTSARAACERCGFAAPRPDAARALGHLVNHAPAGANAAYRLVALVLDEAATVAKPPRTHLGGEDDASAPALSRALLHTLPTLNGAGLPPSPRWVRWRATTRMPGATAHAAHAVPALLTHAHTPRAVIVVIMPVSSFLRARMQAVEVRATRAIAAGEEVYADYGKDPRSLGYLG
jgi:hypothetical protein